MKLHNKSIQPTKELQSIMSLKQINSKTILERAERNTKTLMPHTETGVVTLTDSQQQMAIARQLESTPYRTTSNLERYLELSVGLDIQVTKDFEIKGYTISKDASLENIRRSYQKVLMSLQPLPIPDIEERLKDILLLVILPANFDGHAANARLKAIARNLSKYPADLVVDAIDTVKEQSKFMPSYAEFVDIIKPRLKPRKLMFEVLHLCIENNS